MREKFRDLEYTLQDFLEVKAALNEKRAKPLKEFLFSQRLDVLTLSAVEGFHLSHQLVLIHKGDPSAFRYLIFVTPSNGRFRIKQLSESG